MVDLLRFSCRRYVSASASSSTDDAVRDSPVLAACVGYGPSHPSLFLSFYRMGRLHAIYPHSFIPRNIPKDSLTKLLNTSSPCSGHSLTAPPSDSKPQLNLQEQAIALKSYSRAGFLSVAGKPEVIRRYSLFLVADDPSAIRAERLRTHQSRDQSGSAKSSFPLYRKTVWPALQDALKH